VIKELVDTTTVYLSLFDLTRFKDLFRLKLALREDMVSRPSFFNVKNKMLFSLINGT
jgi:hypothetical protein